MRPRLLTISVLLSSYSQSQVTADAGVRIMRLLSEGIESGSERQERPGWAATIHWRKYDEARNDWVDHHNGSLPGVCPGAGAAGQRVVSDHIGPLRRLHRSLRSRVSFAQYKPVVYRTGG